MTLKIFSKKFFNYYTLSEDWSLFWPMLKPNSYCDLFRYRNWMYAVTCFWDATLLVCFYARLSRAAHVKKKKNSRPPADRLEIFELNRKGLLVLSVSGWFGLGLKGLIFTVDKEWCYQERQRRMQHIRPPAGPPSPGNFYRIPLPPP